MMSATNEDDSYRPWRMRSRVSSFLEDESSAALIDERMRCSCWEHCLRLRRRLKSLSDTSVLIIRLPVIFRIPADDPIGIDAQQDGCQRAV